MKKRIILAPGCAEDEIKKSIARYGNIICDTSVIGSYKLASECLEVAGTGTLPKQIGTAGEIELISQAVKGVSYFDAPSYSDLQQIVMAIRKLRGLIASGDEAKELAEKLGKGIFTEKNDALLQVYTRYMELCREENVCDRISFIRLACGLGKVIDAEYFCLKEFPLTPLDEELLKNVSGENFSEISIVDLFSNTSECGNTGHICSYTDNYGTSNEVETILDSIYKDKKADECVVAITDVATYGQLFFDYSLEYGIPITFGCGIPIVNSNPAKILQLYYEWSTKGFFGPDALGAMINDNAFNKAELYKDIPENSESFSRRKLMDIVGELKLTNNSKENEKKIASYEGAVAGDEKKTSYVQWIKIIANRLSADISSFISTFSYIRTGEVEILTSLDLAAAKAISDELEQVRKTGSEINDDIILGILRANVCRQGSLPGAIHVTDIMSGLSTIRNHIFVAGLSATKFPGSPRENFLILDDDLKQFGEAASFMNSENRILYKRNTFFSLLNLAKKMGANMYLSYAGLNVSELKEDNASSVLFEVFRDENGEESTLDDMKKNISKVGYFDSDISKTRMIGRSYIQEATIIADKADELEAENTASNTQESVKKIILDKSYSPSALMTYLGCPQRFKYRYIIGLPEEEEDDPFEIMSAGETGTLAHLMMEYIADNPTVSKGDFLKYCEDSFNTFIAQNPALISVNVNNIRIKFLEMCDSAYDMEPSPRRKVVLKEEDISCTHESGVKIHGFPDRVEELADGTCLVVDFKTGRKIKHIQDDFETCIQVIIYAYLLEHSDAVKDVTVSGGEYRYLREGQTITCKYDDEMKTRLKKFMEEFKTAVDSYSFPVSDRMDDDELYQCSFCKFADICGKSDEEVI